LVLLILGLLDCFDAVSEEGMQDQTGKQQQQSNEPDEPLLLPRAVLERELSRLERDRRSKAHQQRSPKSDSGSPVGHFAAAALMDAQSTGVRDNAILHRFRTQLINKAISDHRKESCFKNYDDFLELCDPYLTSSEVDLSVFRRLKDMVPVPLKKYFTAKTFIFLGPNEYGTVFQQDFLR
jgi:hypothetical protein